MAFDNRYNARKDRRAPYRGAGKLDRSCRPGGSCPWCQSNRQHADRKRIDSMIERLTDARNFL